MRLTTTIRRHPVKIYVVLAYAISWGGIFAILGPRRMLDGETSTGQAMLIWLAMLASTGLNGVILTRVVDGRDGLRVLWAQFRQWHVGSRWYATLLIAPLLGTVVLTVLAQFSSDFLPGVVARDDGMLRVALFPVLVIGAGVEELGWTGFAVHRMRRQFGFVTTSLEVGTLWGAWHFLGEFTGSRNVYGGWFPIHLLVFWLVPLIALRFLLVRAFDETGSGFLAWLIHASYTAPLFLLTPSDTSAAQSVVWEALFMIAFVSSVTLLLGRARHFVPPKLPVRTPGLPGSD